MVGFTRTCAVALLTGVWLATPATAQTRTSAVVAGPTAVLDAPRGDGFVLGQLPIGTMVEVVDTWGDWCLVIPAAGATPPSWQRGWVPAQALLRPNGDGLTGKKTGRFMVRGFGRAGGTLFTARDSFDTILDRPMNTVYGGGAQIVLPVGTFVEVSVDRFSHDGTLALGSGDQVFRLTTPTRLTLTPVLVTVGHRVQNSRRLASYGGGGVGWYTFEEDSPFTSGTETVSERSLGYHLRGGVELNVVPWLWVAGEAQWAMVPDALGNTGVSAFFQEKDLGGTTVSFKLLVGY